MCRVAGRWIPNRTFNEEEENDTAEDGTDALHGLSDWEHAQLLGTATSSNSSNSNSTSPMGAQREADEQREAWGQQWATGQTRTEPCWPANLAATAPPITIKFFKEACLTFPPNTGLGWDGIHPRALTRLSDRLIHTLIMILLGAEMLGSWPELVGWVIVVLLPKPDGGRRPIGLIPLLPRVWSRARRNVAVAWEKSNTRTYLYRGGWYGGGSGSMEAVGQGRTGHR